MASSNDASARRIWNSSRRKFVRACASEDSGQSREAMRSRATGSPRSSTSNASSSLPRIDTASATTTPSRTSLKRPRSSIRSRCPRLGSMWYNRTREEDRQEEEGARREEEAHAGDQEAGPAREQ